MSHGPRTPTTLRPRSILRVLCSQSALAMICLDCRASPTHYSALIGLMETGCDDEEEGCDL
ncbi:hypothetical protein CSPX01_03966 [Colletotrichum filicis]|nr:hypothetical protein CSPX01_03966 [Colletotrichum filicis]